MFYERQVKYLDYFENEERCSNAGFVKLEVRDTVCNININVTGLKSTDSFPVKVYVMGNDKECELCSLELVQGRGKIQLLGLDAGNIAGTGVAYRDLQAVRIPVLAEREIRGVLEKKTGQAVSDSKPEAATESGTMQATESESLSEIQEADQAHTEPQNAESENTEPQNTKPQKNESLQDTKWKQLWAIYPHVSPFRDEREFLSLGPGDFVILPERYFHLANNSFLLHGYYNYKHLVLKRAEYQGESRYYIGVPGNFYDREKQVAVMFGFESFESLEEYAQAGDFGYYLMRIEL